MKKTALTFISFCLAGFLAAQTISIDSTFGMNGVAETDLSGYPGSPLGVNMVLTPDGKIVVAQSIYEKVKLQQFYPTGIRDTLFQSIETGLQAITGSLAIQQDGKLLTCGYKQVAPFYWEIVRFNPNGTLDSTFGMDGIARPELDFDVFDNLLVQKDGKIIVFGTKDASLQGYPVLIARLNPDGSIDSSFADNGSFSRNISDNSDYLNAGMALPDGKLLFTGNSGNRFSLLRLNSDGSPDSTFGNNGVVLDNLLNNSWGVALDVQPDQKILVTGYANGKAMVVRYHPDGTPDTGFGISATQYFSESWKCMGVKALPNGKIITVMRALENQGQDQVLIGRLLPNGQRDQSFGLNGVYWTWLNNLVRHSIFAGNQLYISAMTPDNRAAIIRFQLDFNVGTLDSGGSGNSSLLLYPNPINGPFDLKFELAQREEVSISLYGLDGGLILTFVQGQIFEPGQHEINLVCAAQIPAGNYILAMEIGGKKVCSVQMVKI